MLLHRRLYKLLWTAQVSSLTQLTSRRLLRLSGNSLSYCIRNLSDTGFDLTLQGALTNIGPLDALIEFEEPVTYVSYVHNLSLLLKLALRPVSPGRATTLQPSPFLQVCTFFDCIDACINRCQSVLSPMLGFQTITRMPASRLRMRGREFWSTFLGR